MPALLETSPDTNCAGELAERARLGDREAFGELAARYRGAVYAIAQQRLGSHADAEELSQEVMLQAWSKIDQLRDTACFGAWLRSMTNRMAINRAMRRGPTIATLPEQLEANASRHASPLGDVLAAERRSKVHAGMERLRPLDRATLEAFYFDGRSLVEMSKSFSSPVGTIKRRLHVARQRLARELAGVADA